MGALTKSIDRAIGVSVGFVLIPVFLCCRSSSKVVPTRAGTDPVSSASQAPEVAAHPVRGTALDVPDRRAIRTKLMDPKILFLIETASPASLREAAACIQRDPAGLTPHNRLYLRVCAALMQLVYPQEAVSWHVPLYNTAHPYLTALNDVEKGTYPLIPGEPDFFSDIIPPLTLLKKRLPDEVRADCRERLTRARTQAPHSLLPFLLFGYLHEQHGELSEAESAYRSAWEKDASCYPAGICYARMLVQRGETALALPIARLLLHRFPKDRAVQLLQAQIHSARQEWSAAQPYVAALLRQQPEDNAALLLHIRILVAQREYQKAHASLDSFAERDSSDKTYLLLRAQVAKEWRKNDASSHDFLQQAYRLYPRDVQVLLACAQHCFETGHSLAQKNMRSFIALVLRADAHNAQALRLLTQYELAQGNWEQAVSRAERLNTAYPSEAHQELLIRAYSGSGRAQEAISLARRLYHSAQPPSETVIVLYLDTLYEARHYREIRAVIAARSASARGTLRSIFSYYEALLSVHEEERLSLLRASLLSDPRNGRTLFALYEWYRKKKDFRKAQYYLHQVIALDPNNAQHRALSKQLDTLIGQ
ncbi:tetratricopeptide repeat protein [Treponema paraluiscuniculi]|uniref:Membrane protein n=1 Tax=Treponema paraluiscuniculi TaxID=53435 RepID=A0ABY9E3C4_9SPIR|nr:tetratricopeptide repeat protein [Treponema paraluiscuniculi]WKC72484.1 putative membrane protein [Treponema paraluiscuniculi]